MSGTLDRLIYMANQIARNLATHADPAAATADHITHFWDPRMKAMIIHHLAAGGEDLDSVATGAIRRLSGEADPSLQSQATVFGAGQSDAG